MGVFKKSLSHALVFSLVLGSTSVYAEDAPAPPKKGAPRSKETQAPKTYERTNQYASFESKLFCSKAPDMLEKLNRDNEDKVDAIKALKADIDEAESYKNVINGVDALKQDYEEGLNEIVKAQSKSLDSMKKVIRNGLILNALGLLLKDSDLDNLDSFKVASICEKPANKSQPLCTIKEPNAFHRFFKGHPLDPILLNFRNAYSNVKGENKANLKADVQKIINSIEVTLSPTAILQTLESASPEFTSLLASPATKEELMKCLDEKSSEEVLSTCKKFMPSSDPKDDFKTKFNAQTKNAVGKINELAEIIDAGRKASLTRFNEEVIALEQSNKAAAISQTSDQVQKTFDIQQSKIQALTRTMTSRGSAPREIVKKQAESDSLKLPVLAALFYKSNSSNASSNGEIQSQNDQDMSAALREANEWKSSCLNRSKTINVDFCTKKMKEMSARVNEMKLNYKTKLELIETKLKKINTDDDNRYKKIETLKKFVAEKYLRTCANAANMKMKKDAIKLDIAVDGKCFGGVQNLSTIEGLESDVSDVFSNLTFALDISAKKSTTGTFNKAELEPVNDVCKVPEYARTYENVCKEASGEKVVREKVKDDTDWEDLNNKYWLSYDESSPTGYSRTEKKSNSRIFATGFLPVVPQILPMAIGNYFMGQNINMLMNQGLYQKQMLHNIDVYNNNPWMYSYPFFGQTYGAGIGTSTTGTAGTGFSF